MSKKIGLLVAVILVLVAGAGFGIYNYWSNSAVPEVEVNDSSKGELIICADKCGDGVCNQEQTCDSLNCTCTEDRQFCPEDCS